MARKPTRAAASDPAASKARKPAPPARPEANAKAKKAEPPARAPKANGASANGNGRSGTGERTARSPAPRSAGEARAELVMRAAENERGAVVLRSDPLADAQAARAVVEFASSHGSELARRGLNSHYGEAALALSKEIENHLQTLPAAATAVRARDPEAAELIADGASMVQPAREAVLRVTRGPDGRRAASAFGIGEAYSARQPHHVVRALRRLVAGAQQYPAVAADAGILNDDLRAMGELADELEEMVGAHDGHQDEAGALHAAHAALRVYFDLLAAKAALAFAADPEERQRLYSLIPRGTERRHTRRAADQAPAA